MEEENKKVEETETLEEVKEEPVKEETTPEEPKEAKKGKGATPILIILIIIAFAVGIGVGYMESKKANKDNTETKEEKKDEKDKESEKEPEKKEKQKTDSKEVELKETDSLVKEAMSIIPIELCGNLTLDLEKGNRSVADLTKDEKLNMILNHYGSNAKVENEEGFKEYYITEDDIKKYLEDLSFLADLKAGKEDSYSIMAPYMVKYKDNKFYITKYATGCEGFGPDRGEIKFKSATKKDNTLSLTVYYYYVAGTGDVVEEGDYGYFLFNAYKDSSKKELVQKDLKEEKDLDLSKYNTYTLTFDTSNNNMRFIKVTAN